MWKIVENKFYSSPKGAILSGLLLLPTRNRAKYLPFAQRTVGFGGSKGHVKCLG